MSLAYKIARTNWLTAALSEQRGRIEELIRKLNGFGKPEGMSPRLFRKFLSLLDQVAIARDKERLFLDRIEAMEDEHHARRQHGLLRLATTQDAPCTMEQPKPRPAAGSRLLEYLVLWYLFLRPAINQKKQGLTVD